MTTKTLAAAVALAATTSLTAGGAWAQQVEWRAASCFPQGSFFSKRFETLVEQINEQGEGLIHITYQGGAPAIGDTFAVVQKVAQGVYDFNSCTGAYYQNVLPEADAWKLLEKTPAEIRENGGWDYINELHNEVGLEAIARHHWGTTFHLFLADGHQIEGPDLSGLHLRTAPIYTNFFTELGATSQTSNLEQVYTLMENGTVQGYGWPVLGHQPGWEKVTKYRVDPGFYDVDLEILANKQSWDALPQEARDLITELSVAIENDAVENDPETERQVAAKQVEEGFEVIELTGEDRETWLNTARDTGWAGLEKVSPEHGPKLREFFADE